MAASVRCSSPARRRHCVADTYTLIHSGTSRAPHGRFASSFTVSISPPSRSCPLPPLQRPTVVGPALQGRTAALRRRSGGHLRARLPLNLVPHGPQPRPQAHPQPPLRLRLRALAHRPCLLTVVPRASVGLGSPIRVARSSSPPNSSPNIGPV